MLLLTICVAKVYLFTDSRYEKTLNLLDFSLFFVFYFCTFSTNYFVFSLIVSMIKVQILFYALFVLRRCLVGYLLENATEISQILKSAFDGNLAYRHGRAAVEQPFGLCYAQLCDI